MTESALQDIIVIGASAGGVEALRTLVAGLPADLPAAIFVVLHIGNKSSILPEILTKAGPLPAVHPRSETPIVKGTIYVAPPDRHLLIEPGRVCVSPGPKENRSRPAVNPLFRSAAAAYGSRVTGVILTGALDDGTAGLAEIKRSGGIAVVQDPKTAYNPSMPGNAVAHVDVDHIVPLAEIPALLSILACTGRLANETKGEAMQKEPLRKHFSGLTCPECRGPLKEERQGRIVEYRCRVGHAYAPLALVEEHREAVERTLWSTLVALKEAADIAERMTDGPYRLSPEEVRKRRERITLIESMLDGSK
jgi:two-component system, chemotaxis family, protein-glutamate methylesterase/glutaminase